MLGHAQDSALVRLSQTSPRTGVPRGLQWCSPWLGVSRVPAWRRSPAEGQEQGRAAGARLVPVIGVGGKYHHIAMKE